MPAIIETTKNPTYSLKSCLNLNEHLPQRVVRLADLLKQQPQVACQAISAHIELFQARFGQRSRESLAAVLCDALRHAIGVQPLAHAAGAQAELAQRDG